MSTLPPEPDASDGEPPAPGGWSLARALGPITGLRLVALLAAVAFLAGAVGWAISERGKDPLSSTDVGFMQDMGFHHEQAVQLSLVVLGDETVSADLQHYAQEIIVSQRYEQGLFNAILDRFGHSSEAGDQVMGWMGSSMARDDMPGLATEAQIADLQAAEGPEAESLWIALMTEHHLAGLHMADWEARNGRDAATRDIARAMVRNQRGEVVDLNRYRTTRNLPLPTGFADPMKDPRLTPPSLSGS